MNRFTAAIEESLLAKNWNAALFMALTLPDICCRLETDKKVNGYTYAAWFDRYLSHIYVQDGKVFLSGHDCYALRCALLHEGVTDLSSQPARTKAISRFHFTIASCDIGNIDGVLQLDVRAFCRNVISAVNSWFGEFKVNDPEFEEKLSSLLFVHVGDSIVEGVIIAGEDPVPSIAWDVQSKLNEMYEAAFSEFEMQAYLLSTGYPKVYVEEKITLHIRWLLMTMRGRELHGRREQAIAAKN